MIGRSLLVAMVVLAPALALAAGAPTRGAVCCAAVVAIAAVLRGALARGAPDLARGYFVFRLLSPRYLAPALLLPAAGAVAVDRAGVFGIAAVLAVHVGLAARYRRRLARPGALARALPAALVGGFFVAIERLATSGPELERGGRLLYAEESPLQRVVLLERAGSMDMLIDGELQFRSADERDYHAGLVGPLAAPIPDVLILGGGDGLAARDLLARADVARITIADWDPAVTRLSRGHPAMRALNGGALDDPRVSVVHADVRRVLADGGRSFDAVIGDLTDPDPDPTREAPMRSIPLLSAVRRRLAAAGVFVTHATSVDGEADDAVRAAVEAAGFSTRATHRELPSFGRVVYLVCAPSTPALAGATGAARL